MTMTYPPALLQQNLPGNYRLVSLLSIPGKVEQFTLGAISKHVEDKRLSRSSQYKFTKGKSCLTNLIAFYGSITRWIDEGRADFNKAFRHCLSWHPHSQA